MVSVSRRAGPPHFGQVVFRNDGTFINGDPPDSVVGTLSGKSTGKSFSGTGTTPSFSQYTIGIGVPQYRCREMPQSFSRNVTVALPNPFSSARADIFRIASSQLRPLYSPEFTTMPSSLVNGRA